MTRSDTGEAVVRTADTTIRYGNWEISYDPPPIPSRNFDWQFSHKDFDGAPDACDNRYGAAASLLEAMTEIDDREDEAFDNADCGCRMADPSWCLAVSCKWREDQRVRLRQYEAARVTLEEQGEGM